MTKHVHTWEEARAAFPWYMRVFLKVIFPFGVPKALQEGGVARPAGVPRVLREGVSVKSAIICDIDGTIARHPNRGHHQYSLVGGDDPIHPVIDALLVLGLVYEKVILVSAREDYCREETKDWLDHHGIEYDSLFMRATGDFRRDDIVKEEIYHRDIEPRVEVKLVLDDRDRVVQMWRRLGLTCFQVAEGDF